MEEKINPDDVIYWEYSPHSNIEAVRNMLEVLDGLDIALLGGEKMQRRIDKAKVMCINILITSIEEIFETTKTE